MAGLGRAAVPGASAGADRHRWFSWGSGGRGMDERRPGTCVELVLEDDGGGLAIDPRPIGIALGLARRSAGPTTLHRAETGLGEMAAQPFVAECYRNPEPDGHGVRPGPGQGRLRTLRARPPRAAGRRPARRRCGASTTVRSAAASASSIAAAPQRRQRSRRRAVIVGQGQADPALPEVDPEQPASRRRRSRRARRRRGPGVSISTACSTVRSTRLSKLGTEPVQSGETEISTSPNGARMAFASSTGLPRTIASSAAGSRTATCSADAVTGKLTAGRR